MEISEIDKLNIEANAEAHSRDMFGDQAPLNEDVIEAYIAGAKCGHELGRKASEGARV